MPYRIEVSPNARAGCKATLCKNQGIKITKGELRHATMVTIQEKQSWQYRHWGCVTPTQLANMKKECEMDMDMVDGYDELPADIQEKVYTAIAEGHVANEDWKGDPEKNHAGAGRGMFLSKTEKQKLDDEDEVSGSEPETKPATKKRARGKKTDDAVVEEAPAPKKAKATKGSKATKAESDKDEAPAAPPKKAARGKKAAAKAESDVEAEPPKKAATKKKAAAKPKKAPAKSKKAAVPASDSELSDVPAEEAYPEPETDDNASEPEEPAPKPKRGGRKKKA